MLGMLMKSFHVPVRKRRQKGLRGLRFALLLVVFKWHHGSEGVNVGYFKLKPWSANICLVIPCSDRFRHGVDFDAGELDWQQQQNINSGIYTHRVVCLWESTERLQTFVLMSFL